MANTYEILDGETVINTILADADFVEHHYKGRFRLVSEVLQIPPPETPPKPLTPAQLLAWIDSNRTALVKARDALTDLLTAVDIAKRL